ncbi:hypothetical protein [Streptacidiphilus fuscans]|uniref:Uncharacterized protein n=1 Tax=Streptacidiphilus fuscans TaxID=2789292 RepID=A0A931BBL4_9ACTN|nr:hypothetical protein [Streptacidiphilus fuscans]MBF9073663.1 hypothetical protein [Streptacidiphilus fuscans]
MKLTTVAGLAARCRPLLAAALLLAVTAGCSSGHGSKGATGTPPPSALPTSTAPATGGGSGGALSWIVSGQTLSRMVAVDGTSAAKAFDTPTTYVLTEAKHWDVPAGWTSTPTADFTSYSALRTALRRHTLDPRIRAVLYDNEHWSLTPAVEQSNPVHYDQLAAQLAHDDHLLFLASPATDLATVLAPDATGGSFDAMLASGLFGQIAPSTDVLDIQSQGAEPSPARFASYVRAAAAQARAANPHIQVLAGISTNPSGQSVTAAGIELAARSVRSSVDGYWLNDPAAGTACPRCNGPLPQTALTVATNLAGAAPTS